MVGERRAGMGLLSISFVIQVRYIIIVDNIDKHEVGRARCGLGNEVTYGIQLSEGRNPGERKQEKRGAAIEAAESAH